MYNNIVGAYNDRRRGRYTQPQDERRSRFDANPLEETLAEKFLYNIILGSVYPRLTTLPRLLLFSPSHATRVVHIMFNRTYVYVYII